MKKIALYTILLSSLTVSSCKKYLEQAPDQRADLNTPEKVSELLVSAYPRANYFTFCEAMSDNVTDNFGAANQYPINSLPYIYDDVIETNQDSPIFYWNNCYDAIASANQALDAIKKAADPEKYTAQKGEALVARAYAHFMLVSLFSKFYDPATAATDPGIPYVLEPETVVSKKYERKTVAYVYEMIEKDLTEGIPLINNNAYKIPAYHFTKKAAHAFATRFYLYKQAPDKVIEHAGLAFPGNSILQNMRNWINGYYQMSSDAVALAYTKATEPANLLIGETSSWYGRRFRSYRFSSGVKATDAIFGGGGKANLTGGTMVYRLFTQNSLNYYVRKFQEHFVRTSINASTGVGYNMVPLFTTEEVLMNRAEAYVQKKDYENALKDINLFISQRVVSYVAATHNLTEAKALTFYKTTDVQVALTNAVLDLKRMETIHEGLRWFDILRHKMTVVHTLWDGDTITSKPGDLNRVLQLPEQANLAGIELNPR
ncbi:RagB/SusD family nutrient uptake outer membrane protein [Chitinophaga sp. SYP-B3965]|uniref:RagB/SusD family nutrient uptake outer membrane protein n=1 Tax=Chitinophaga sp. SYP-B3965 TaxID=2663120 RepID=UPI0012998E70|nr:RagB/SusD family nutrient uptake outer membrane protein [Chitinophaga sp. SYP-B3965]MRG49124.1 RagB/SusD family nutrient uptake outer membrane protein [Chitinophaga sp. SYP-B3965]